MYYRCKLGIHPLLREVATPRGLIARAIVKPAGLIFFVLTSFYRADQDCRVYLFGEHFYLT